MRRLVAAALICTSCAATRTAVKGTYACTKADVERLMPDGHTLGDDVLAVVEGDYAGLEADLSAFTETAGTDAVKCAVEATILATPVLGADVTPDGVVRARHWESTH